MYGDYTMIYLQKITNSMRTFEINTNGLFSMKKRISDFWRSLLFGPLITICLVSLVIFTMEDKPGVKYFAIFFFVVLGLYLFFIVSLISVFELKKGIYEIGIADDYIEIKNMYDVLFLKKKRTLTLGKSEVINISFIHNLAFSRSNQSAICIKSNDKQFYLIEEFFNEPEELAKLLGVPLK